MRNQKGFTLLEFLLSFALIALLVTVTAPVYRRVQMRNDLDLAIRETSSGFRRARLYAQVGKEDGAWGVRIDEGVITVFQGDSYATRDTAFDEAQEISSSLTITGVQEVVFSAFTGNPSTTGTVTYETVLEETRTATINGKGMIEYGE